MEVKLFSANVRHSSFFLLSRDCHLISGCAIINCIVWICEDEKEEAKSVRRIASQRQFQPHNNKNQQSQATNRE